MRAREASWADVTENPAGFLPSAVRMVSRIWSGLRMPELYSRACELYSLYE